MLLHLESKPLQSLLALLAQWQEEDMVCTPQGGALAPSATSTTPAAAAAAASTAAPSTAAGPSVATPQPSPYMQLRDQVRSRRSSVDKGGYLLGQLGEGAMTSMLRRIYG